MFNWLLFPSACFFVLVNTHPLIQNVQPYPVTNYQQNVYRQPHSEAFMVQPSNTNHYPQQLSIQTPVTTYQTLQVPSLTEQITQLYWDKLLSNPTLRSILDASNIENQCSKDVQTYLNPYNSGGVVNNYIIVPPDYLKINETIVKEPGTKQRRNGLGRPVQVNGTANQKKKQMLSGNRVNIQDVKSPNNKTPRKSKQSVDQSWNFNTNNIKCFTPADVLENEKYQPERMSNKNNGAKKQCNRGKSNKNQPSSNGENKNGSRKSKKMKEKKIFKKKSKESGNKATTGNISSPSSTRRKTKQNQKVRKSVNNEESLENKTDIVKDIPQFCEQDINDVLLLNLLQQGCTNLENRHTRNSKTDTTVKDFRNMYPDLSSDLSKSLTWYMNDLFSPHSLQYIPNFNTLEGDTYPFDFTQIYQIPQYSNADVNKSKENSEKNKSSRRKKKKKKNSKPKTKKGNDNNGDSHDHSQIPETNIQISETRQDKTQIPEINNRIPKTVASIPKTNTIILDISTEPSKNITRIPEINIFVHEKSTTAPNSAVKVTSTIDKIRPSEITPISITKSPTDTVYESITPTDNILEQPKEPFQFIKEIPEENNFKTQNQNMKSEEKNSEEIYETQIPNTIVVQINNESDNTIPEYNENVIDDILTALDSPILNQLPKFSSEDEIFNMLMNDYYPDFRADNHAYLVSDEEIDARNTHDRYFYVTDKNIDSREMFSLEQENHLPNKGVTYNEDEFEHNVFERNNKNVVKDKNKPQEIVFRTPPGLEVPDFITRKINRDRQDSNEIYYQHSVEDDFDRFNLDNFADNSNNFIITSQPANENNSGRLVETVYAKSKVIKYGQAQELDKSFKSNIPEADDFTIHNDGDKMVVIAKSFRPEDYW